MWNRRAEIEISLKMQVKHLRQQVEAFRSCEKYQRMEADYRKLEASDARKIKALKKELGHARAEVVSTRERWMRVNEDCVDAWERERKRMEQKLARKDREIAALKKRLAEARTEKTEQKRELYAVETELEEAHGQRALQNLCRKDGTRKESGLCLPAAVPGHARGRHERQIQRHPRQHLRLRRTGRHRSLFRQGKERVCGD